MGSWWSVYCTVGKVSNAIAYVEIIVTRPDLAGVQDHGLGELIYWFMSQLKLWFFFIN